MASDPCVLRWPAPFCACHHDAVSVGGLSGLDDPDTSCVLYGLRLGSILAITWECQLKTVKQAKLQTSSPICT